MSLTSEHYIEVLTQMGREVGATLNWDEIATKFAELVTPEISDYCGIWWQDQNGQLTLRKFSVSKIVSTDPILKFRPECGPERVVKESKIEYIPSLSKELEKPPFSIECFPLFKSFNSYLCLPLVIAKKCKGAIVFLRRKGREPFDEEEVDFLAKLCDSVTVALDHAQLYEDSKNIQISYEQSTKNAQLANEAKTQFLANMSHEIRTPLTAIIGFSDLILQTDESPVEVKDWSSRIKSNGMHLLKIVNEILDISKIEAGQLEFEYSNVDLQKLIFELVNALEPQAQKSGNRLTFLLESPVPSYIFTDQTRVMQILLNIIGNALKFTDHGVVKVKISFDRRTQDLKFSVEDNGIGLTPEQTKRLFKPFSQADVSHARKFGGTGLGLNLAQRIARLLGGDVKLVKTKVGEGSTFLASIKHQGEPAREFVQKLNLCRIAYEVEVEKEQTDLTGKRLLLAEDSLDYQRLIALFFGKMGLQIDYASTGKQALDKARSRIYDFILMDIQMPEMGGFDVCQQLRDEGYNGKIIALTASDRIEDREHAQQAGFDDYVTKPIDRTRLTELLKNASPVLTH